MLGIIDTWYAFRKHRKGFIKPKIAWNLEIFKFDERKITWICFVPIAVSTVALLRKGLIPREGSVFVYTISSLNLVTSSPEDTLTQLQGIYDDAMKNMKSVLQQGYSLSFLGVSLGNVLSIRLASEAQTKVKDIISIVGGGSLGLSGWDSILTGRIARESDCFSAQEYEERLSIFSPINYISSIEAERIVIRLATHDLLIRFKDGKSLADAFFERSKKTPMKIDYRVYPCADHSSSLLFSALENLWRKK